MCYNPLPATISDKRDIINYQRTPGVINEDKDMTQQAVIWNKCLVDMTIMAGSMRR